MSYNSNMLIRRSRQVEDNEPCLRWVVVPPASGYYNLLYAGEGVVDWGDGTSTTLAKKTSFTYASHKYANSGVYRIKMTGDIEDIVAGSDDPSSRNAIVALEQFNLPSYVGNRVSNDSLGVFAGCSNLVSIDPNCRLGENIKSLRTFFNGAYKLQSLSNLVLPAGVMNLNGFCAYCISLESVSSNLFPHFTAGTIIMLSFLYRTSIIFGKPTGTLPADKLWGRANIVWGAGCAFSNCTSLSNYDDIPAGWK